MIVIVALRAAIREPLARFHREGHPDAPLPHDAPPHDCILQRGESADAPAQWRRDFARSRSPGKRQPTALGDSLVGTTGALYAVDPTTGDIRWSHRDLADVTGAGVVELAGSSLCGDGRGARPSRTAVVNMRNGVLVFDSRKEQLTRVWRRTRSRAAAGSRTANFRSGKPQPTLFLSICWTRRQAGPWSSDALNEGMSPGMKLFAEPPRWRWPTCRR